MRLTERDNELLGIIISNSLNHRHFILLSDIAEILGKDVKHVGQAVGILVRKGLLERGFNSKRYRVITLKSVFQTSLVELTAIYPTDNLVASLVSEEHLKEHKGRHIVLHKQFDELVADWLSHNTNCRPSTGTVMDLMEWSYQQTINPMEHN